LTLQNETFLTVCLILKKYLFCLSSKTGCCSVDFLLQETAPQEAETVAF